MKALPLLLIGGAALFIMGGKKRTKGTGWVVDETGHFPAGEPWRIIRKPGTGYIIEADLEGADEWIAFLRESSATWVFNTAGEARAVIQKVADGDLLIDERGKVSA